MVKKLPLFTKNSYFQCVVKNIVSSENTAVRDQLELAYCFRNCAQEDPDLHWIADPAAGGHLQLDLDGKRFTFAPYYELKPSVRGLEEFKVPPASPQPLIVTIELSRRILALCKERKLSAIDLNGRAWLRAPGLLVDRAALPGRSFRPQAKQPKNIFIKKSARILRSLFTDREKIWTQTELVRRTKASIGLVSEVVQHLERQGLVQKITPREFRLRDWQGLLNEWAENDRFSKRTRTVSYSGFLGSQEELAHQLQQWANNKGVPFAFTQWFAAWKRHPYTEPVVCSAYVARLPDAGFLQQLGLRQVEEGGKLWLHIPDDEGVFLETQSSNGFNLSSDVQVYLDLQRTGLRGPDAAQALREWEGFCRQ